MKVNKYRPVKIFSLLLIWGLAACSSPQAAEDKLAANTPETAPPAAPLKAEIADAHKTQVLAMLASADALDGASDKIIGKCASCNLRMAGSADHGLEVESYAMHFCSEHCQKRFATETADKILAMNLPEPAPQQ